MYKLKGRTIWDVPIRSDMSWSWRKLLQIREMLKPFIWMKIGDGRRVSAWYDRWDPVCPLSALFTPREIATAGFHIRDKVADIFQNGAWMWPQAWLLKAPILLSMNTINLLANVPDMAKWRDSFGVFHPFSVQRAWEEFRPHGMEMDWANVVWFNHAIPRHSFVLWLVMKKSLKTQDRLQIWDVSTNVASTCSLCECTPDSHSHLFFACPFASKVWSYIRHYAGMDHLGPNLDDIVDDLKPNAAQRKAKVIIGKLLLAAAVYFVWNERNARLFKGMKRSPEDVRDLILVTVRLKLLTFRFKKRDAVLKILARWSMPHHFRLYGD